MEQVERRLGREKKQRAVFGYAFQSEMNMGKGRVPVVADVGIKIIVFLFGYLFFILGPDGLHGI